MPPRNLIQPNWISIDLIQPNWISIDVETAGPDPGAFPLLAIGACLVSDPANGFYVELVPDQDAFDPQAMAVHGLTMAQLRSRGTEPAQAMAALEEWISSQVDGPAVMVAFNAPFDWMFISQYFWYYLGRNPLGHAAIDIKALAMGWLRVDWSQTSLAALAKRCGLPTSLRHHALDDARQQAELLQAILAQPPAGRTPSSKSRRSESTR